MKHIDYYTILGVSRNRSQDEIRRAYRTGAQKHHPDVNKEPEAESRFKEINEAYRYRLILRTAACMIGAAKIGTR